MGGRSRWLKITGRPAAEEENGRREVKNLAYMGMYESSVHDPGAWRGEVGLTALHAMAVGG